MFKSPWIKLSSEMKSLTQPSDLKTIIFTHHPCPDGIAAIVCLEKKFGHKAAYHGLNHARLEDMRTNIFSRLSTAEPTHIIFADITPPFDILKEILENPLYTVTILDHHPTAILALEDKQEFLQAFIESMPIRLHLEMDLTKSGVGIAYDYVNGKIKPPVYVSLVQAIDLFTATANSEIIREFCKEKIELDGASQSLMESLGLLAQNNEIQTYIDFYVFACIFDLQIKAFFKESNNQMNSRLISSVKHYFELIEKNGMASLLNASLPNETGELKSFETIFRSQLEYQKNALENAVIIPSLINDELDILFIDADIQSGRTFNPLIAQKLSSLPRPTIAMIVNTKNISSNNNWASLRSANDTHNLYEIALRYKARNLVENAGGHAKASALQFSQAQLLTFLNLKPLYMTKKSVMPAQAGNHLSK